MLIDSIFVSSIALLIVPAQPNVTTSIVSVASTVVTAGSPLGIDVHLRDFLEAASLPARLHRSMSQT